MKYRYERFQEITEIVDFLNENKIKNQNIISITFDGYFHNLIYLKEYVKRASIVKYGICTDNKNKTSIGAIYILEELDEELFLVLEGNCDTIRKDAITFINKDEYNIIRNCQNEVLKNIDKLSKDTEEYFTSLYNLRNIYKG